MADLEPHGPDAIGELDPTSTASGPSESESADDELARARTLLASHPVVDGHNSLAHALVAGGAGHDVELGESSLDTDLPRLRAGGVGAQFWALHAPGEPATIAGTLRQIDAIRSLVAACPGDLRLALTTGDMADARNCGRIASLLGPVAGPALGDTLATLRVYHALGVRSVALAGARWTKADEGLTRFGVEVVREMNRLGLLIDLSGAPAATMRRVLEIARAPLFLSRSAARALTDHPSNVPDDILRLLGPNGGVCMVGFAPDQVARHSTPAALRDVADHLDHVREVAGPECVGLSGTFGLDGHAPRTVGLEDASCYPHLIAELLRRDWTDIEIADLTWGNAARVVREAEFVARALRERGPSTLTIEELDDARS